MLISDIRPGMTFFSAGYNHDILDTVISLESESKNFSWMRLYIEKDEDNVCVFQILESSDYYPGWLKEITQHTFPRWTRIL